MNPFLGQIMMFGGNFAPRGWAFCHGQLLPIAQNTALFSLLGTIYGGDGRTTFALPDMKGRVVVSPGHGPGLSTWSVGEKSGSETNTLNLTNLAAHNHFVNVPVSADTPEESTGKIGNAPIYAEDHNSNYPGVTVSTAGAQTPLNNMAPWLAVNYIIALQGTFPSRS